MTTEPEPLTERMDAALKATEPVSGEGWRVNPATLNTVLTPYGRISVSWMNNFDPSVEQRAEHVAALIAAAPTLRALLSEARATIAAQAEALARVQDKARLGLNAWTYEGKSPHIPLQLIEEITRAALGGQS